MVSNADTGMVVFLLSLILFNKFSFDEESEELEDMMDIGIQASGRYYKFMTHFVVILEMIAFRSMSI